MWNWPRNIADYLIRFYQAAISPMLGANCRFTPTCSQYARQAIARHGLMLGGVKACWRVLRCNPFSQGGYDPVERSDAHDSD